MADLTIDIDLNARGVESGARRVRASVAGINEGFSGLKATLANFAGGFAAGVFQALNQQLIQGVKAVLDYSSRMEQLGIAFETLLGSAAAASKHLADIQKFAAETPFETESLAKMSQRLQGVGVAAEQVIPLMRDIGNITAATGEISTERISGITVALTQMISKTKVSAEEMEQLNERGVPGWKILAEAIGKTQAETRKLAEAGVITSDIMIQAVRNVSKEKFGDAMAKQSKTFAGAWSTIRDTVLQNSADFFKPVYDQISKFSATFATELSKQENATKTTMQNFAFSLGKTFAEYFEKGKGSGGKAGGIIGVPPVSGLGFLGISRNLAAGIAEGRRPRGLDLSYEDPFQLRVLLRDIETQAKKIPSLAEKLKAEQAAVEARKLADAVSKISSDLERKLIFFGDDSEVAATKQRLLAEGVTNFKDSSVAATLAIAKQIDGLKAAQKASDEYNAELKEGRARLEEFRENARLGIELPTKTDLDRFNEWADVAVTKVKDLKSEIAGVREIIKLKIQVQTADQYVKSVFNWVEAQKEFRRSFDRDIRATLEEGLNIDPFQAKLRELGESILALPKVKLTNDAKDANGISAFPAAFANDVDRFVTTIQALRSNGVDASAVVQRLIDYMDQLGTTTDDAGNSFKLFDSGLRESIIPRLLALKDALKEAAKAAQLREFEQLMKGLKSEIEDLTDELSVLTTGTARSRVEILRLSEAYEKMTPQQQASADARAGEIDTLRAQIEAVKELNEKHAELKEFFSESLRYVFEGDFGGLFENFRRRVIGSFTDRISDFLATKILGVDLKATNNPVAKPIVNKIDKTNQILNAILGRLGGSPVSSIPGLGGIGGTPPFNPGFFNGGGASTGSVITLPNGEQAIQVNGSQQGGLGGLFNSVFGPRPNALNGGKPSRLGGILGGIGDIATVIGGAIGGRAGGIISAIGTGASIGAMFGGAWGAAIGAGVGALFGILSGDPKRKRDKNENIPALNRGFTDALAELRQLVGDVRTLRVSPDSALSRATELRNSIAAGFGIQFESKKYRKIAADLVRKRLVEADGLIEELRQVSEVARAAGERERRILPEFASGGFPQVGRVSLVGERGPELFVPNVRGRVVSNEETRRIVSGASGGSAEPIYISITPEISIDADGMVRMAVKSSSSVQREIKVVVEDQFRNDELKLRRR